MHFHNNINFIPLSTKDEIIIRIIRLNWKNIVGEYIYTQTYPYKVDGEKLIIYTNNGIVANKLDEEKIFILKHIKKYGIKTINIFHNLHFNIKSMWENDKELFLQKKAWEKDSNNTQTRKENDFINFEQDIAKNIKDDRLKRASNK